MSVLCIVQARMKSTRLPGKVMKPLGGGTVVEFLLYRLAKAKSIDKILLATSTEPEDVALAKCVEELQVGVFLGDEQDVLGRFHEAIQTEPKADTVVRITADCPLMDPSVVDQVIADYRNGGADYVSNTIERSFPDGLDVEVFSRDSLQEAHKHAKTGFDREHVTPWIRESGRFACRNVANVNDRSALRLTLDEPEDYEVIKSIVGHFAPNADFSLADILDFLDNEGSELPAINGKLANTSDRA